LERGREYVMTREEKTGIVAGGIAGLLVWLFDWKHIILGGSPQTPVSDFIHSILPIKSICGIRLEGVSFICDVFVTLLVLTFTGIATGFVAVHLKKMIKK
jgi:hypothetical protein